MLLNRNDKLEAYPTLSQHTAGGQLIDDLTLAMVGKDRQNTLNRFFSRLPDHSHPVFLYVPMSLSNLRTTLEYDDALSARRQFCVLTVSSR